MKSSQTRPADNHATPAHALTASESADDVQAPIDTESLLARCFGKPDFAQALLIQLESIGIECVEEIQRYANQQDAAGVTEAAHALKGAADIVCAPSVQRLAACVEQAGRTSEIAPLEPLLAELSAEMQRCLIAIPRIRRELTSDSKGCDEGAGC